jgi:hypothetical protein
MATGKKMSAFATVLLSLVLISFAGYLLSFIVPIQEMFFGAQGGEMVQLAAGRVPTMANLQEQQEEAKQVRKEIVNMTGYW